jgi:O-antigen biosynthesis protein WbqP
MFLKVILTILVILAMAFILMVILALAKKGGSVYKNEPEQRNRLEGKRVVFVENENEPENADGVRGHLEAVGESSHQTGFYEKYIKRGLDVLLSFGALVVLSPVFLVLAVAIYIDDPGPILFTQKRVGKNKEFFKLHKFRSMKMCTPHDKPTHMLENPEFYITRVGKFLRAHSLDELPQIWDIFIGNMSVIGERGIIETTKNNADFSRVVTVNSISL